LDFTALKEKFQVQYKLSSVDRILGVMLITTGNYFDFSFFLKKDYAAALAIKKMAANFLRNAKVVLGF